MEFEEKKERKEWRSDLMKAAVFAVIAAIAICLSLFLLNPKYEEMKEQIAQTSTIARKITSTLDEADQYLMALDASGKVFNNIVLDKDSYIQYAGVVAQENQLKINKMTVDDILDRGTIYTMRAQIELQGSLYNVKNFVQELYDSETVCRINSFSYRIQAEDGTSFQWMWRSIDDQQLVPWWNLQVSSEDSSSSTGEPEMLDADKLLRHGTALCYLDVEFIGTGG